MPIYEYLCNSCGVKKEHIQKMSDAPVLACPECGGDNYVKQISAAGFQLKGSGWYVTDFKNKPSQSQPAKNDKTAAPSKPSDDQTNNASEKTATPPPASNDKPASTSAATD